MKKQLQNLNDPEYLKYLAELKKTNYDKYMNLTYMAITQNPDLSIADAAPVDKKTMAIDAVIDYFESNQEYEKCGKLKALKDKMLSETKKEKKYSKLHVVK